MKIFYLKADFTFQAENIDDAFRVLVKHFKALRKGEQWGCIENGSIDVAPVREEKKQCCELDFDHDGNCEASSQEGEAVSQVEVGTLRILEKPAKSRLRLPKGISEADAARGMFGPHAADKEKK